MIVDTPTVWGGWQPVPARMVNLSNVAPAEAALLARVEEATARRRQAEAEVLATHRRMRAEQVAAELRDVELHRLVRAMHALRR